MTPHTLIKDERTSTSKIIRFIIADDHPTFRAGVVSHLRTYPERFQMLAEASDGFETYQLCKQFQPDLLILDIKFSGGGPTGLDVIEALKQDTRLSTIKVLVLSGEAFLDVKSLEEKGVGYLDKTFSFGTLMESIEALLASSPTRTQAFIGAKLLSSHENSIQTSDDTADTTVKKIKLLSSRELEVLLELSSGKSNIGIANSLTISTKTVTTHLQNIYPKLDVENRTEAAIFAVQNLSLLTTRLEDLKALSGLR